jgi:N utilization substance protein B
VAEHFEMPHAAHAFARDLVVRVVEGCVGLDAIVSSHAKNWRVSRMAVVDRNILRLATFELAHTKTPAPVVLNEAVELARRFGSEESPPFVNGVLDAVARQVRGEEPR